MRVTKKTFRFLLDIFKNYYNPEHLGGREPVPTDTLLLLTLWYLGNQTTYREISELFGLSEGQVHICVQQGIKILCTVAPQFIKWPSLDQIPEVETKFKELAGFPGVIGAIDVSHIPTKAPEITQADYINRKSTHSVNLIAVCDSEKKFTFVNAGFAGSAHDSRVFKLSPLFRRIEATPASIFPSTYYHLIGDSGFQLAPTLLVPFKDYGNLNATMTRFNTRLSQTRYVIENSFGLLKGRFRRLKYLDCDVTRMPDIILACCALHSITLGQANEEAMLLEEGYVFPPVDEAMIDDAIHLPAAIGGSEKRDFVAALL